MCKIVEDIVANEMKEERIEIAQCSGLTEEEVKAVKVLQPA